MKSTIEMSAFQNIQLKFSNQWSVPIFALLLCMLWSSKAMELGEPFSLLNKVNTKCEVEALRVGTALGDHFNSYDEATEWDARLHNDYLTEHLGFAPWIQGGVWGSHGVTAEKSDAPTLHKRGGWAGLKNITQSSYWALENQWIYMMGDSTTRQVWATFVSPFQSNEFERNAKEWTREHCARQHPHRKEHPSGGYFPEEGWGGKCGNNEVTCDLSGFGADGKITFDWKHFPYEDYDEWVFGESGKWNTNITDRRPDILTIQIGLHTCFHALADGKDNETMIENHVKDISKLMSALHNATNRPTNSKYGKTMVIFILPGRIGNPDIRYDKCSWRLNRIVSREAHRNGFPVLEREEIERRFLYKSEHFPETRNTKVALHLDHPGPQIVGTSLLALIACIRRNGTAPFVNDTF